MVLDVLIVIAYFAIVMVGGFWAQRRSGKNLESYFLGSHGLPWWTLAMSGSASNFSLMGTMWMCTVLYVLGMKSYWIHWFWALPLGISLMSYMAIWIRRTGVMTAAELLQIRFGAGRDAVWARTLFAVMAVLMHVGTLGMAYVASTKFLAVYMERLQALAQNGTIGPIWGFDPAIINPNVTAELTAVVVTVLTAAYVLIGGFKSVIITDVLQTLLLAVVGITLGVLAFTKVDHAMMMENTSGLDAWLSFEFPWSTTHTGYEAFGPLTISFILIGMLICLGGAGGHYGEQRFLAARNTADAAKAAALWQWIAVPRWTLVAGIVVMALGTFENIEDTEKVMPMVLDRFMTVGLRGLVIAGLIAAYMSTVSSLMNSGASMMIRDIWQPFFAHGSETKHLVHGSRIATVILVAMSLVVGFISLRVSSIDGLWRWLMAGLGASFIVPNALRWYWWRMNGWGFVIGTAVGFILSVIMLVFNEVPQYIMIPLLLAASFAGCVIGSLATPPVKDEYINEFYRQVRPFGFWKSVRARCHLSGADSDILIQPGRVVINFVIGTMATYAWYMLPVYIIGKWWSGVLWTGIIAVLSSLTLYFTWYKALPDE